jgi:hypothetical protein
MHSGQRVSRSGVAQYDVKGSGDVAKLRRE